MIHCNSCPLKDVCGSRKDVENVLSAKPAQCPLYKKVFMREVIHE